MRKLKPFKAFHQSLKEDLVDLNKLNIAKQALLLSDHGPKLNQSMSKKDAVKVLRDAGHSDEQIRRMLIVGGALPQEIENFLGL